MTTFVLKYNPILVQPFGNDPVLLEIEHHTKIPNFEVPHHNIKWVKNHNNTFTRRSKETTCTTDNKIFYNHGLLNEMHTKCIEFCSQCMSNNEEFCKCSSTEKKFTSLDWIL